MSTPSKMGGFKIDSMVTFINGFTLNIKPIYYELCYNTLKKLHFIERLTDMSEKKFMTHYEKLKVSRDASDAEITKAYNEIVKKYNPDNESDDDKKRKYIQINKIVKISFDTLIDPVKRKEHDDLIYFIENDDLTKEEQPTKIEIETVLDESKIEKTSESYNKFNALINKIKSLSKYSVKYFDRDLFNYLKKYNLRGLNNSRTIFYSLLVFSLILSTIKLFTGDFVDNGDGTITSKKTGLMWQRCSIGQVWKNNTCEGNAKKIIGFDVMKYNNNSFAGYKDWRVPSEKELMSLVECSGEKNEYENCVKHDTSSPSINLKYFPNTESGGYWTSSNSSGEFTIKEKDGKRSISFKYGTVIDFFNWGVGSIRLVRSEKSSDSITDTNNEKIVKENTSDSNTTNDDNDISTEICKNKKEIMEVVFMDKKVINLVSQSKMRFNSEENTNLRGYLYGTVDLIYSFPENDARKMIEKSFVHDCVTLLKIR